MEREPIKITQTQARQGTTGRGVRYVLIGGLALAAIAFLILMIAYGQHM